MKKIPVFLITTFLFSLLLPLTSAYLTLDIYLQEDGNSKFMGASDGEFEFPQGISYENGRISGTTTILTSKQAETWHFELFVNGLSEIYIHLPERARITKISNGEVYNEKNTMIVFGQGDKVTIAFDYALNANNSKNYQLFYLIGTLILLAGILILIKQKKKPKKQNKKPKSKKITKTKKLEIIKQTLSERQQEIISKLQEVGKIKHSRLQRTCEIPKASFSRHILELENKGLIKRVGDGRNKFVELK